MPLDSRDIRKVMARLAREGWMLRRGSGAHIYYSKGGVAPIITIDSSHEGLDRNIYKGICGAAGWSNPQ